MSETIATSAAEQDLPANRSDPKCSGALDDGDRAGGKFTAYRADPPHARRRPEHSRFAGKAFCFAEDFDSPASSALEPEIIPPTFSAAELEAARAEAFQAGSSASATECAAADHAAIRQVVSAIAAQFAAAREDLLHQAEQSATTIARLLLGALGTMLPELTARYGEAELQAVIRAVHPGLFKEPGVIVRVNPCHADATAGEVARLDPDLASRLRIVPADAVPRGDVRITWRNGGASRDAEALWTQVIEALGLVGLSPLPADAREHEHAG